MKSTYKNQYIFYISTINRKKELRKTISFIIASKNKIPRNKLNNEVKNLYSENHKQLKKEI
jgi:hypothetical protein